MLRLIGRFSLAPPSSRVEIFLDAGRERLEKGKTFSCRPTTIGPAGASQILSTFEILSTLIFSTASDCRQGSRFPGGSERAGARATIQRWFRGLPFLRSRGPIGYSPA